LTELLDCDSDAVYFPARAAQQIVHCGETRCHDIAIPCMQEQGSTTIGECVSCGGQTKERVTAGLAKRREHTGARDTFLTYPYIRGQFRFWMKQCFTVHEDGLAKVENKITGM
jgi:hypothetical protein